MLGFGLGLNKWRRVGGGYVGLLDLFPNAAAAYSLRLLRKDYSGGLVRARAWDGSANQGEADVMAYRVSATEYVLDLNSTLENLDATAISRGLTTSDTLADLVSTGVNDYDGLTSAWYDQSLSNDATQSTAAAQPKIVSGGSLVTENGKPAIDFDGVNDLLQSSLSNLDISNGVSSFSVVSDYSAGAVFSLNSGSNQTSDEFLFWESSSTQKARYGQSPAAGIALASTLNHQLFTAIDDGNSLLSVFRNSSTTNSGTSTTTISPVDLLTIGARGIGSLIYLGKQQENIFYPSDQSANRTGIEANINTFYSIYP